MSMTKPVYNMARSSNYAPRHVKPNANPSAACGGTSPCRGGFSGRENWSAVFLRADTNARHDRRFSRSFFEKTSVFRFAIPEKGNTVRLAPLRSSGSRREFFGNKTVQYDVRGYASASWRCIFPNNKSSRVPSEDGVRHLRTKESQVKFFATESLILAQNERWRHGLGMQVERRCSNAS